jgi:hypothetical protein
MTEVGKTFTSSQWQSESIGKMLIANGIGKLEIDIHKMMGTFLMISSQMERM